MTWTDGLTASATNVGNRPINLTYLGYAIKTKDGRFNKIYPYYRQFDCEAQLAPSAMFEVHFQTNELLEFLMREERSANLYVFANDTEGIMHKRIVGTVGKMIDGLTK